MSSDIDHLANTSNLNESPIVLWEGTILETALSVDQRVHVLIKGTDNNHNKKGPCPWMPRGASGYPQAGDRCLVGIDDEQNFWIVVWGG